VAVDADEPTTRKGRREGWTTGFEKEDWSDWSGVWLELSGQKILCGWGAIRERNIEGRESSKMTQVTARPRQSNAVSSGSKL